MELPFFLMLFPPKLGRSSPAWVQIPAFGWAALSPSLDSFITRERPAQLPSKFWPGGTFPAENKGQDPTMGPAGSVSWRAAQ